MFKKSWKRLRNYFTPLESSGYVPILDITQKEREMSKVKYLLPPSFERDEDVYRRNAQNT